MSLQLAAKHLATKGRGPDTELVHMTKGEIRSLQDLARAHGGSLTVNPKTGLPEAGFLSAILPAALGAASTYFTGNPYYGMAVASALGYKQSGLRGAITSGISAYGGGQLAAGYGASGAAGATSEAGATTTSEAGLTSAVNTPAGYTSGASYAPAGTTEGLAAGTTSEAGLTGTGAANAGYTSGASYTAPTITSEGLTAANTTGLAPGLAEVGGAQGVTGATTGGILGEQGITSSDYNAVGRGISTSPAVTSGAGSNISNRIANVKAVAPGSGLTVRNAYLAALPALSGALSQQRSSAPSISERGIGDFQRYSYTPGAATTPQPASATGRENIYFPNQGYSNISQADAIKAYGYAGGGDIQGNDPSDTQGDPNLQNVRSYDPVVRMKAGGINSQLYAGLDSDTAWRLKRMAEDAPTKPKLADEGPMKKPAGLSDMPGLESGDDLRKTKGLYATGGLSDLGGYSDGGRLLRGPGDGVSDSIPATISNKRPARLADGEFVVPARIVSELGNGSTEAGARQLYAMMDRVQKARGKTVGKGKIAKNTNANRYLPA